ncbi:MAG: NmrA family NAD(P)-binding protein [Gemmatimonadales bacterium]|nr:NmrA family NAD(P)-binding protein [Gemmatimonadales bacterium]MDQ3426682.1 NmrA family NAD(P)-binding protein [Gemmatimonadota bacterium]
MTILAIGGTGTVGSEVVRGLVRRGRPVRVLSRSAAKASALPPEVEGAVGDLGDPASLTGPFRDIDAVFLVTALDPEETRNGLAAVTAARAAKVSRLVYMSVHNLEQAQHIPHFASKIPIERAIRESGIPYALVQPNNFYQVDYWFAEVITRYGVYPQPIGGRGIDRVDVRDIADAVVNALDQVGTASAVWPLVGPEALTGEAVAQVYSRLLDRPVRYGGDDLDAWATQARAMMPEWMVHDLVIMYRHFQTEGLMATSEDRARCREIVGHDPRQFEAFAAELTSSAPRAS